MKKKNQPKQKSSERPVQYFTEEYLEQVKHATPAQIVRYLEATKRIYYAGLNQKDAEKQESSVLISMRVPSDLLEAFKAKADLHNTKYQTLIKKLMRDYIGGK